MAHERKWDVLFSFFTNMALLTDAGVGGGVGGEDDEN